MRDLESLPDVVVVAVVPAVVGVVVDADAGCCSLFADDSDFHCY